MRPLWLELYCLSLNVAVFVPETVELTVPLHVPAALTGARGEVTVVETLLLPLPQPEKTNETKDPASSE